MDGQTARDAASYAPAMLNWKTIARAELHPIRFGILELLDTPVPEGDPGWSASTIAKALSSPLAATSHHLRTMRDRGWVVVVEARHARGAI